MSNEPDKSTWRGREREGDGGKERERERGREGERGRGRKKKKERERGKEGEEEREEIGRVNEWVLSLSIPLPVSLSPSLWWWGGERNDTFQNAP